ncbi:MAG: TIGR03118 family protein [Gemmatimonadetes bacterium]|nr:MAG: TIGR03118 family protein [Gemmatimonadota bacterium]
MERHVSSLRGSAIAVAGLTSMLAACSNTTTTNVAAREYLETRLVADTAGLGAASVDSSLKNPWGMAFGPTGVLWVSDNHSGASTLYDTTGAKRALVVAVPSSGSATGGAPSGIVYNPTADFVIPGSSKALFIFAGEDGVISAWNASTGNATLVADRSGNGAVYKGLAMAANGGANFLFATDFKQNGVDVFDATFQFVKSFTDSTVPAGYAPFGIQAIGGQLYVTFAKQLAPANQDDQAGPGNGYVDVFNTNGTVVKRFATRGALNSPWGVALAPAGFGGFSGDLLLGNFGDGRIGAYDPATGSFIDFLRDGTANPIVIDGLWGLTFGPSPDSTTLFFTAGPDGEAHGLLGTLTAK